LQNSYNKANAAFNAKLNQAKGADITSQAAINSISLISQATANMYINQGAAAAMSAGSTWGCTPGSLTKAAITTFTSNVNTAKASTNAKIAAVRDNKQQQHDDYVAYQEYIKMMEVIKDLSNYFANIFSSKYNAEFRAGTVPYDYFSSWASGPQWGHTEKSIYGYLYSRIFEGRKGNFTYNGDVRLLTGEAKYYNKIGLWDDRGGINPSLILGAEARASIVQIDANGEYKSNIRNDFSLPVKSNIYLGTAEAVASVKVGFDENGNFQSNAKASAIASVISGKVSGGVKIGKVTISTVGKAHLASEGVTLEGGYYNENGKKGVRFVAGAADFFGASVGIDVSW
jgi:hypothetical protein